MFFSLHAFEITDPSILLLSEHKSHEPFATLAQTFTFSVQWASFMYPPPDSPVHLIYPGLTQTSSYVASPFPQCGIHITEVAADAEDLFFFFHLCSHVKPRFIHLLNPNVIFTMLVCESKGNGGYPFFFSLLLESCLLSWDS